MNTEIIRVIKLGGIVVMSTDTIYGITCSAINPKTVEKIYKLRKRSANKPFIILIASLHDLSFFNINLSGSQKKFLEKNWPNPLSVILPIKSDEFQYLHKGENSLAFRMPKDEKLQELLNRTGSLVAPSANLQGEKPAQTIEEAKAYFGNKVSYYEDGGYIKSEASTLIKLNGDGSFIVLRQGSFRV